MGLTVLSSNLRGSGTKKNERGTYWLDHIPTHIRDDCFLCVKQEKGIRVIKHRLQPITFLANMSSFDFVQLSEERSQHCKNLKYAFTIQISWASFWTLFAPRISGAHCGNVCFHYRARIYFETVLAYQKRPLYYWLQSTCLLTLMSLKVCLQRMGVVWR